MGLKKIGWIGLLILLAPGPSFSSSEPVIRVAILKGVSSITLQGEELRIQIPELKPTSYYIPSPARIRWTQKGFKVGTEMYAYPSIRIFSLEDTLSMNEKNFEGFLEIRPLSNHQLLVINELPLERYLVGLIHGEINAAWPREAIKAQAVAARTYALYTKEKRKNGNNPYDLETDTMDQVYSGFKGLEEGGVEKIIEETQGEVLWYLGLYPAYFHSCCGGQTETTNHVWGRLETSASVVDPFCERSPYKNWELVLSTRELLHRLKGHGLEGTELKSISLDRFDASPRNALVIIETNKMTLFLAAGDLRRILGYDQLKSTWFQVQTTPLKITFQGAGYGHGVGLCQWGAKAMAEAQKTYREILEFYYPKAVLKKTY